MRIRPLSPAVKLTRGARVDAPRRDATMTPDSDAGDAAGDAGTTTDGEGLGGSPVKIGLRTGAALGKELPGNYTGAGALIGAVVTEKQLLRRRCDRPQARRRSHALGRSAGKRQRRGSTRRGRFRWRRGRFRASGRRRRIELRRDGGA